MTLSNGDTVTLNAGNNWTATVEDLPKYASGEEIEYTWTESGLPAGYELTGTSVNGTVTTLTNAHVPEKTEATVRKVWNDSSNQDGKRPESVRVSLAANGTNILTTELNAGNNWTYTEGNLDMYAGGERIAYGAQSTNYMDLYYPETVKDETDVVFLIHGGAWIFCATWRGA